MVEPQLNSGVRADSRRSSLVALTGAGDEAAAQVIGAGLAGAICSHTLPKPAMPLMAVVQAKKRSRIGLVYGDPILHFYLL
jgi:hypothetical protein